MNHSILLDPRRLVVVAVSAVLATLAHAQNFTDTTSGTDSWQLSGTNGDWTAQLVSDPTTSVQFGNGITYGTGTTAITSTDDITAGTVTVYTGNPAYSYTDAFELNNLTLGGTTTVGNNPTTITIAGPAPAAGTELTSGALDFVSNGTTSPTVTLSGKSGSGLSGTTYEGLVYKITDNIVLSDDTTFTGTGTGLFMLEGQLAGSGDLILGGAGSTASLFFSAPLAYDQVNNGYAFTGNLVVNTGTLGGVNNSQSGANASVAGADFYTNGSLTINSGANFAPGNNQTTALGGLYGTGSFSDSTNNRPLYLNYVGQTTDEFDGSIGGLPAVFNNGDGVFSMDSPALPFGGSVQQFGSGLFIFNGTSTGSSFSIGISNSYGVLEMTGSGSANGSTLGGATSALNGGTLWIQPTFVAGGGANPTVIEPFAANGSALRVPGGANIVLDANGNSSVTLVLGTSTSTATSILTRTTRGTLTITPTAGIDNLGNSYDNLIVESSTSGTTSPVATVNGLASLGGSPGPGPDIFVADTDAYGTADFATYLYAGGTNDGFAAASNDSTIANFNRADTVAGDGVYTNVDNFTGTTNTSVVDLTSATTATPITLAANTAAYALRITGSGAVNETSTGNLVIGSGTTFTLGSGVSGSVTGLILNGGVISGPGSLAVGNTELVVYTDLANGTIASSITGTDGLTKTGPGTLFLTVPEHLTTTNSQYTIDSGALDVGTFGSTSATLLGNASGGGKILLDGGVLEGNGVLAVNTNSISLISGFDGGYAAYNGDLDVYYNGSFTSGTPNPAVALTWGANALSPVSGAYTGGYTLTGTGIFAETSDQAASQMLIFGSNVSNSQVTFENAIALGLTTSDYYRDIYVNLGTGTDSAVLAGVISDTADASYTTADGVTYTADGVGTHGILKDGPGTLITTANNTYSGTTEVNSGSLFVNGQNGTAVPGYTGPGQGSYTVAPLLTTAAITYTGSGSTGTANAVTSAQYNYYNPNINPMTGLPYGQTTADGALLGGTGNIGLGLNQTMTLTGNSPTDMAHLAPGLATSVGMPVLSSAPGANTLTVGTAGNGNSVNFGLYSSLDIYIDGDLNTALNVIGSVNITDSTIADLTITMLGTAVTGQVYDILNYTPGADNLAGEFNNGASTVTASDGEVFDVIYKDGEVDLVTAIPEPKVWGMMLLGLGLLGFIQARRRGLGSKI